SLFELFDIGVEPVGVLAQPLGDGGQHGVIGARFGKAHQPGHPCVEHAGEIAGLVGGGAVAAVPEIDEQRIVAIGLAFFHAVGFGLIGLAVGFGRDALGGFVLGDELAMGGVGGKRRLYRAGQRVDLGLARSGGFEQGLAFGGKAG